jgi:hypothetical protein
VWGFAGAVSLRLSRQYLEQELMGWLIDQKT